MVYTNVKIKQLTISYWIAALILLANILNMAAWSLAAYLSTIFQIILVSVFFIFTLKSNPTSKVLFIIFLFFSLYILGSPVSDWDARSIWFFHGKRIFFDNNLYSQLDGYAQFSHNDYPILFSSLSASIAKDVGYWNEFFPRLAILLILFPVFLIFNLLLRGDKLSLNLWILGTLFTCRAFLYSGYMDAILALYCSCSAVMLLDTHNTKYEHRHLWQHRSLMMLVIITLPFIKNEGILASLAICLSGLCIKKLRLFYLLALAVCAIIYFWLWKSQVIKYGIDSDLFSAGIVDRGIARLSDISDIWEIFKRLLRYSGIYILVFFAFLRIQKMAWIKIYPGALFTFLYLLGILAVYTITPADLIWHLDTSANRTFLTINMCLYSLVVFYYAKSGRELAYN